MRKVFFALVVLLFATILVQFYFAAFGAFDRPRVDGSFSVHRTIGTFVIPAIALLSTIAAAVARAPKKIIGLALLPVALILIQMLIRAIANSFSTETETGTAADVIFGVHAVVGLITMAVVGATMRAAREFAGIGGAPAAPAAQAKGAASVPQQTS